MSNQRKYHAVWQNVLGLKGKLPQKRKWWTEIKRKWVKESNSLLFNSQTILPHIAKGKNALKCIISEQTWWKLQDPNGIDLKKRLGKIIHVVIYRNSQKF